MVVFFDIDGTLVEEASQIIPDSAVRGVARLRANGHIPVINTGRPYSHIDPRVRAMAFEGYVCGCGMEIRLDGRWLHRTAPGPEVCAAVLQAVRDCRMQVLFEGPGGEILRDGELSTEDFTVAEARRMADKGFPVLEISRQEKPDFIKLVTLDGPDSRRQEFIRRVSPWYTCIEKAGTMMELVMNGCSKARGMELLLDALGASREDTLAIGDSTNDLPMFRAAGHTACMGDGMEEMKAISEFVTAPVLEDGVEKALQHFGLI